MPILSNYINQDLGPNGRLVDAILDKLSNQSEVINNDFPFLGNSSGAKDLLKEDTDYINLSVNLGFIKVKLTKIAPTIEWSSPNGSLKSICLILNKDTGVTSNFVLEPINSDILNIKKPNLDDNENVTGFSEVGNEISNVLKFNKIELDIEKDVISLKDSGNVIVSQDISIAFVFPHLNKIPKLETGLYIESLKGDSLLKLKNRGIFQVWDDENFSGYPIPDTLNDLTVVCKVDNDNNKKLEVSGEIATCYENDNGIIKEVCGELSVQKNEIVASSINATIDLKEALGEFLGETALTNLFDDEDGVDLSHNIVFNIDVKNPSEENVPNSILLSLIGEQQEDSQENGSRIVSFNDDDDKRNYFLLAGGIFYAYQLLSKSKDKSEKAKGIGLLLMILANMRQNNADSDQINDSYLEEVTLKDLQIQFVDNGDGVETNWNVNLNSKINYEDSIEDLLVWFKGNLEGWDQNNNGLDFLNDLFGDFGGIDDLLPDLPEDLLPDGGFLGVKDIGGNESPDFSQLKLKGFLDIDLGFNEISGTGSGMSSFFEIISLPKLEFNLDEIDGIGGNSMFQQVNIDNIKPKFNLPELSGGGINFNDIELGFSLEIDDIKIPEMPAKAGGGLFLQLLPQFKLDFKPELAVKPDISIVKEPYFYLSGEVNLQEKLPGGGGQFDKVEIDLGLIYQGSDSDSKTNITNYKVGVAGTYVNGTKTLGEGGSFDFWFFELLAKSNPLIPLIGFVNINSLGGIGGNNVEENVVKENFPKNIKGIGSYFTKIQSWDKGYEPANNVQISGIRSGLAIPVPKLSIEGLLLLQWSKFSLNAAVKLKHPLFTSTSIFVYDVENGFWTLSGMVEMELGQSSLIKATIPYSIGEKKDGKEQRVFWAFMGHFDDSLGSPVEVNLFDIFRPKAYVILYETRESDSFGFPVPSSSLENPEMPTPYSAFGVQYEFDKTFGASFANVRVRALMGFNVAVAYDPFMLYGNMYASGGLEFHFFGTIGLDLTAFLAGMMTSNRYKFQGEIDISIGTPWWLPDLSVSFGLEIKNGEPSPEFKEIPIQALAHHRIKNQQYTLRERDYNEGDDNESNENNVKSIAEVPLDAILSVDFDNTPIEKIRKAEESETDPNSETEFLLAKNDEYSNDELREIVENEYDGGESFKLEYTYELENFKVTKTNTDEVVQKLEAAWEFPMKISPDVNNKDIHKKKPQSTFYLNTQISKELDYYHYKKESEDDIVELPTNDSKESLPCENDFKKPICIGGEDEAFTDTVDDNEYKHGKIIVKQIKSFEPGKHRNPNIYVNVGSLQGNLSLPYKSKIEFPSTSEVSIEFSLELHSINADQVKFIDSIDIYFTTSNNARVHINLNPKAGSNGYECNIIDSSNSLKVDDCDLKTTIGKYQYSIEGELTMSNSQDRLNNITIIGHYVSLVNTENDLSDLKRALSSGEDQFKLDKVCYKNEDQTELAWENSKDYYNGEEKDSNGAKDFWKKRLLDPDTEYSISFDILKKASEVKDNENVNSKEKKSYEIINFCTASEPPSNIKPYVDFTMPEDGRKNIYPDTLNELSPVLGYKYAGLIEAIFEKFNFSNYKVVIERLNKNSDEDEDDDEKIIQPSLLAPIKIYSTPKDEQENVKLYKECFGMEESPNKVIANVFKGKFKTNQDYAFRAYYTNEDNEVKEVFSTNFSTSYYESLEKHIEAINKKFENEDEVPSHFLVEENFSNGNLFDDLNDLVLDKSLHPDKKIERFYQKFLGVEKARYSESDDNYCAFIKDSRGAIGAIIEMNEPLLNKKNVKLKGEIDYEEDMPLGVRIIDIEETGRTEDKFILLMHDASTSRLIALHFYFKPQIVLTSFSQSENPGITFQHFEDYLSIDSSSKANGNVLADKDQISEGELDDGVNLERKNMGDKCKIKFFQ